MKPSETQWNQVKSNEIKWSQAKPSETKWSRVKPSETKWSEVKPSETKWSQSTPGEINDVKWNEAKRHQLKSLEIEWGQAKPSETKLNEVKSSETRSSQCHQVKPSETKRNQIKWKQCGKQSQQKSSHIMWIGSHHHDVVTPKESIQHDANLADTYLCVWWSSSHPTLVGVIGMENTTNWSKGTRHSDISVSFEMCGVQLQTSEDAVDMWRRIRTEWKWAESPA